MSQDQRPDRSRITELLRFQGRNRHARLGAERAHCVDDAALASIPSDISGDLASLYPLAIVGCASLRLLVNPLPACKRGPS